jgi:LytS/YehU family sensor histidine kinase
VFLSCIFFRPGFLRECLPVHALLLLFLQGRHLFTGMDLFPSYVGTALVAAILLLAAAVLALRISLRKSRREKALAEEKYRELELKIHSLEMETIKYKLNPHLFKNTLNSIQSHAYQTYYALDKLSNVLDFILYESERKYVSLKQEVDFALSLIEINRLKVSPLFDLRVKNRMEHQHPLYAQELVAPLITTELIENAFKHADLQHENAFITIVFELTEGVFSLTVSNKISSVSPLKKENGGFGNESLKKRLDIIYKDNYRLDRFREKDTYVSHLKLNLLGHKAEMFAAG